MKATVRARLTIGLHALVAIGSVVSVAILLILACAVARGTTWVLAVAVTGLGLALSCLLARSLARPIVRMAASMARAAKGDLSDALEFDARTDELGELSRSINATYL